MFLAVVWSADRAAAQEVGHTVVVTCETPVRIGNKTLRTAAPGECLTITEIRSEWVGVSAGWIARCAVNTPQQAIERFSQWVCQDSRNAVAYVARGNARLAAGQTGAAITDYQAALCLKPDYALAKSQLAVARASAKIAADNVIESFDMKGIGDLLVVPVTIGGREYDFLLDTGASSTVFDPVLIPWFKPTDGVASINGGDSFHTIFDCPSATIGRSKLPIGKQATKFDLSDFRTEGDIWGIIGMDTLKQVVLQLDFDAGKVRFLKSSAGAPGEKLPLTFERLGSPTVKASLADGPEESFMLDTGSFLFCDCSVSRKTFEDLVSKGLMLPAPEFRRQTITDVKDTRAGVGARVALGPFELGAPVVYGEEANYISLFHLSRFVVTMDFAGGEIFLQKGRQYDRRIIPDRSGFDLQMVDGAIFAANIGADGWSHDCGVREEDRILEINGKTTVGMILREAMLLIQHSPGDLLLKVESEDASLRTIRLSAAIREGRAALDDAKPLADQIQTAIPAGGVEHTVSRSTAETPRLFEGRRAGEERDDNSLALKLLWCPPGKFTMGSPRSEANREADEDQASVMLTKGFWLGRTEVTEEQWQCLMGTRPWSLFPRPIREGADYAATGVSWNEATDFAKKLTRHERLARRIPAGWKYRLPTEAEWEYACRAGSRARYSFGDDESRLGDHAWWGGYFRSEIGKAEEYAHRVGQKTPNPWGLYDMHGNVDEWCRDWKLDKLPGGTDPEVTSGGSERVTRGGNWYGQPVYCRSASRGSSTPSHWNIHLGFRLVLAPIRRDL
jgi:formylglycine-generating enzyme required for sulfatase activity